MINKVILVGNTGSDPEVRNFENGGKIARVNVATTEQIFNPTTNERKDHTEWHTLIFKNSLAGVVEMYVRKGRQLYIEGKLRNREWSDAQGVKHRSVEIHVDTMKMLGNRQENIQPIAQNTTSYAAPQQQYQQAQVQQQQQYTSQEHTPVMPQPHAQNLGGGQSQGFGTPSSQGFDPESDDLPF
ncbi:MAG: single-stranded DNA-binding protein [Rikenellaceae bacterium]